LRRLLLSPTRASRSQQQNYPQPTSHTPILAREEESLVAPSSCR
jgi:hypothetical protein